MSHTQNSGALPSPETNSSDRKWYQIRLRVIVLILLLLLAPIIFLSHYLESQHAAVAALKSKGAIVRTEVLPIPFIDFVFGAEKAQHITEVYWIGQELTSKDLALCSNVSSINKLELTNSRIEEAGLEHLNALNKLYTLHLSGTGVSDSAMEVVSQLESLEILSLNKTDVGDPGLSLLVAIPQLERLFLNQTAVTDKGLESLGKMRQLKELSLKNLPISDHGLKQLEPLVNLEILALDNNPNLTKEGILSLRGSNPRLVFSMSNQETESTVN